MSDKITYSFCDSLVKRQAEAEKQMLAEWKSGDYTFEKPLIKLNPYLINPLAAVVLFTTEKETAVTLTVYGKEERGNIVHTFPRAKEHVIPVVGLYGGCENRVELRTYEGNTQELTITTEPLSGDVPKLCYMKTEPEYTSRDLIFVTPSLNALATGFDYRGDVRWHLTVPVVFDLKRLKNGNTLISGSGRVTEFADDGSIVWEINPETDTPGINMAVPAGIQRLENGNTIVCNWGTREAGDKKAVHIFEITPDKRIVWEVLSDDFGDVAQCQLLTDKLKPVKNIER